MCLDLDANTIAFHKNGAAVCLPQPIGDSRAYRFAFDASYSTKKGNGDAVTIVE